MLTKQTFKFRFFIFKISPPEGLTNSGRIGCEKLHSDNVRRSLIEGD